MSNIIDRILAEVCLDERIQDGVFDLSNNAHMDVLRESLTDNYGVKLNDVRGIHNKMVEGKYPERQAYNKDGLLVTFPTPQHKAKAISRGTHFEQDPNKGQSNVFGGGQQPPAGGQPPAAGGATAAPEQPAPNVFDKEPAAPSPASEKPAAPAAQAPPGGQASPSSLPKSDSPPPAPAAPAAPAGGSSGGSSLPTSDIAQTTQAAASDTQGLEVEPAAPTKPGQPEAPAPPPNFNNPKPPEQRAAEAKVVKQMMSGDPNNPSLSPTMPVNVNERRYIELNRVYNFAREMGYAKAMEVISEAMNTK